MRNTATAPNVVDSNVTVYRVARANRVGAGAWSDYRVPAGSPSFDTYVAAAEWADRSAAQNGVNRAEFWVEARTAEQWARARAGELVDAVLARGTFP